MDAHEPRARRLVAETVARLRLDLRGLTVYTEAASGPYRWNPLLAAQAGGTVVALAGDSPHHAPADVTAQTLAAAARWGLDVRVVDRKRAADLAVADVVTNTGPVRPIDAETVAALRPTAVVALMWETWELVPGQVDVDACRARGVLVLGTDERRPPCPLAPYAGLLALRVLFDLGLEIRRTRVLLLGRQAVIGAEMERALRAAGAEVDVFGRVDDGARPYADVADAVRTAAYDVVLVAEHADHRPLIADGGPLPPRLLAERSPGAPVAVVAGQVDAAALGKLGVRVVPDRLAAPGAMSMHMGLLGPRPVLELFGSGLLVGAVAARARLAGASPREAAREALRRAPAMDLPGRLAQA